MTTTALTPRTTGSTTASTIACTTARTGPRSGELRLTRRGRLVVVALALVSIFAVGLLLSATSVASDDSTGYPTRVVVATTGDTIWDIADDVAGDGSTREMVATIRSLNDLADTDLASGQRLVVPLR